MMPQLFLSVKPPTAVAPALTLVQNALVALAYLGTGYAGLQLALVGDAVTLFWPPSGIAFAALWLGGFRLLPGVAVGAFLVNLIVLGSPQLATVVAVGNALPASVATIVLRAMIARREIELRGAPGELWRVLWFILVAALGSTMLSATIGTLVVEADGRAGASIQSAWLVWWMGDAMGVVIVAPPLLLWRRMFAVRIAWRDLFDALAFALAGFGIIAGLLLIRDPIWAVELCKLFTLLLSLWAGTRFGLTGPAAMTLLMAIGAVGVTMTGVGPFARARAFDSFALLHSYLFAEAIAGMLLAAALADLRRTARAERIARDAADAASADRIRLLTMISHDVRNPLGGIMGVLQVLDRAGLAAPHRQLVGMGLRAGTTLTTLVTDILDVARADAGRITLQPAPFSPSCSLSDVVAIHRATAEAKGLALALVGDTELPQLVTGDRARFEQVIGNLVANAVAYTPAGSVTVSAHWQAGAALPLAIEVADTGPGLDPALMPRLFDAFVLARRPGGQSAGLGLGLGLHICRNLVELMGGTIACRAGPGSVFTVNLPLAVADTSPEAVAAPASEPALNVLLVDDDPIARSVTAALLHSHGHHVAIAADADAAVAAASTVGLDLILLDIQLGPLGDDAESGLQVARRIRSLPGEARSVAIVALTADGIADHHRRWRAAGLDGVIVKPFTIAGTLADAIGAARLPAIVS